MTDDLTAELARLNELQQAVDEAKVKAFTPLREEGGITYYDREDWYVAMQFLQESAPFAVSVANKLHAENERLKALLVAISAHAETADGWEDGETFYKASILSIREELHAAGIGAPNE